MTINKSKFNKPAQFKLMEIECPFDTTEIFEEDYTELTNEEISQLIKSAKHRLYLRHYFMNGIRKFMGRNVRSVINDATPELLSLSCGPRMIALLEEVVELRERVRKQDSLAPVSTPPPSPGSEVAVRQTYAKFQEQMDAFINNQFLAKDKSRDELKKHPKKYKEGKVDQKVDDDDEY